MRRASNSVLLLARQAQACESLRGFAAGADTRTDLRAVLADKIPVQQVGTWVTGTGYFSETTANGCTIGHGRH